MVVYKNDNVIMEQYREIEKLKAKLKACEALVERWRDEMWISGESNSFAKYCADELESELKGENQI